MPVPLARLWLIQLSHSRGLKTQQMSHLLREHRTIMCVLLSRIINTDLIDLLSLS